jgi:hypothetical protein
MKGALVIVVVVVVVVVATVVRGRVGQWNCRH